MVPDDIISNVLPVCAHRVISKTYMHAGHATTRRIMQKVLESVPSLPDPMEQEMTESPEVGAACALGGLDSSTVRRSRSRRRAVPHIELPVRPEA